MNNDNFYVISVVAFSMTTFFLVIFKPFAYYFRLLDIPNDRKNHQGFIPLIGGIAIFFGVSVSLMIQKMPPYVFIISTIMIVILGIFDDKFNISFKIRLLFQIFVSIFLCAGTNFHLNNLGDFLGIGLISTYWLAYPITIFAVVGVINAFNMIDGIDGLLASNAIISFASLFILFIESNKKDEVLISLVFIIALIPYLLNNLNLPPFKQKIFMGDAGSMLIGLTIVWLLIDGSQSSKAAFSPVIALWIIAVPLMDIFTVIIRRLRLGLSPFHPDHNHIHHVLIKLGYNQYQTLGIIILLSIFFDGIALISHWLLIPDVILFFSFLLILGIYNLGLDYLNKFIQ
jgi:UDP-GlcNAc:undecaprenyl-phosphate GlcNAc-1-phosphate transferase